MTTCHISLRCIRCFRNCVCFRRKNFLCRRTKAEQCALRHEHNGYSALSRQLRGAVHGCGAAGVQTIFCSDYGNWAGLASYVGSLDETWADKTNVEDYARLIFDRYLRRQLIALGNDIVNDAYAVSLDEDASKQMEIAEKKHLLI